jgi:hypothetical protein
MSDDIIKKDIELFRIEELPFNNKDYTKTFTFTKRDTDYEM